MGDRGPVIASGSKPTDGGADGGVMPAGPDTGRGDSRRAGDRRSKGARRTMMSRFRNLWVRFWMQLAGRGLVGRFATRMATMLGPRFYDRVSLSHMNRGG